MPLLQDITVIFAVATFSLLLCSRLKIPGILGYLITGLIVGPNGLGLVAHVENVDSMAEIGVVLLLFTIGLEFSLKQLVALKRSAIGGGLLQLTLTTALITVIGVILQVHVGKAIFYGLLITLSSTAIVLKLLMERGEIDSPAGRITTSLLIFQDIAVIPMMLIIPALIPGGNASFIDISLTMVKAIVVVILLFATARFVVPKLLTRVTITKSREIFLFSIILICMIVAFITNKAGLSLALGAFLAGMVVSETGFGYQALGNVVSFKDVFTGFFFVSMGMLINIEIFASHPLLILGAAIFVILIKVLISTMSINVLGYPLKTSMKSGLAISQIGEFSFILAASGTAVGILTKSEQSMFISVSVLTMAAAPFLIQFADKISAFASRLPPPESIVKGYFYEKETKVRPMKDHIIIVGYGPAGRNIAKVAINSGVDFMIIEMNPQTVKREQSNGVPIFYGDASQDEILEHAKIDAARAIVVSGADASTTRSIVENVHRINPSIAIIVRTRYLTQAGELKELGATDVIIEEIESSVALLTSVLKHYYISTEEIEKQEAEIRQVEPTAVKRKSRDRAASFGIKGVAVETITVPVESHLSGKTLRDIDARYRYNINIIAIKSGDHLRVSPGATDQITERDELLVTGKATDISIFASIFNQIKETPDN